VGIAFNSASLWRGIRSEWVGEGKHGPLYNKRMNVGVHFWQLEEEM
jgi:hypothetical protein